jgi:superfamily I DNA/RNA helicase
LAQVGFDRVEVASLSINYRTPAEVMSYAEPVIRAELPDANVPTSVRSTGIDVRSGTVTEFDASLDGWLAEHPEGTACVIRPEDGLGGSWAPTRPLGPRVRVLTPQLVKGLEFDLVIVVGAESFGAGIEGAVDRYVAMTRATQQLVVLRLES